MLVWALTVTLPPVEPDVSIFPVVTFPVFASREIFPPALPGDELFRVLVVIFPWGVLREIPPPLALGDELFRELTVIFPLRLLRVIPGDAVISRVVISLLAVTATVPLLTILALRLTILLALIFSPPDPRVMGALAWTVPAVIPKPFREDSVVKVSKFTSLFPALRVNFPCPARVEPIKSITPFPILVSNVTEFPETLTVFTEEKLSPALV
ncbi:hypothetical protein [Planktothrix rubescens]|uniref:hypothetical protein n=1 Tax=Planktothrix rubescens TaxID=59512 RepID=UPI00041D6819|nr:hypothetical protein [Planktothrix rubescens]